MSGRPQEGRPNQIQKGLRGFMIPSSAESRQPMSDSLNLLCWSSLVGDFVHRLNQARSAEFVAWSVSLTKMERVKKSEEEWMVGRKKDEIHLHLLPLPCITSRG